MTGSRRRTTMSATEALAFLRSLPTADDRVLAAQPLLCTFTIIDGNSVAFDRIT